MHAVLAQTDSTGLQESLTVISTALSVGLLLFALSKARQRVPLRPVFDAVRLAHACQQTALALYPTRFPVHRSLKYASGLRISLPCIASAANVLRHALARS